MTQYQGYIVGAHGLEEAETINAESHELAWAQFSEIHNFTDKKYLYLVDMNEVQQILSSQDGQKFIRTIHDDLKNWRGSKSFFRSGGVPGCRVLETGDLQKAAAWLAQQAIIQGAPCDDWYAHNAVEEIRSGDEAYSPDYCLITKNQPQKEATPMEPTNYRQDGTRRGVQHSAQAHTTHPPVSRADVESATFRAYLAGRLALPSETERILAEMREEKRRKA